jgi:hypothetical protein
VPETTWGWTRSVEHTEGGCMKVISCNLAGRQRHIPQQIERLACCTADVVALQTDMPGMRIAGILT